MASVSDSFFVGSVLTADPSTFVVEIASSSSTAPVFQGKVLSSALALHIGIKDCALPQPGSQVFCFATDKATCLVLGVIPPDDTTNSKSAYSYRTTLGAGSGLCDEANRMGYGQSQSKPTILTNGRPSDTIPGDAVWANDFGVLLGLFSAFTQLKASELAQIQMFLLDDLVRIVSHNFQHFTCMGESRVFQDRQTLDYEAGYTHDPLEALGKVQTKADNTQPFKFNGESTSDDTKQYYSLDDIKLKAIERLKIYIGNLGDFVNIMLTAPAEDQVRKNDGKSITKFDTGLASIKIAIDGAIHVRSLKEVFFEKTNWIRVPTRTKEEDSPNKDTKADPNKKPLFKFDDSVKLEEKPSLFALQLRDYLAYSYEVADYFRFNENKDFELNKDRKKEQDITKLKLHKYEEEAKYQKAVSGIYMMTNGGIVLKDAWGSAIVMEGGNIYLQAANDLIEQPLRNHVVKAGNTVSVAAKKDIEISSTEGGARVKTDKALYLYSDSQGIVLHSNAQSPGEVSNSNGVLTGVGGIVFNAPKSSIVSYTDTKEDFVTNVWHLQANREYHEVDNELMIRSEGYVQFTSARDMIISSDNSLFLYTDGTMFAAGKANSLVGFNDQYIVTPMSGKGLLDLNKTEVQTMLNSLTEVRNRDYTQWLSLYSINSTTKLSGMQFKYQPSAVYGGNITWPATFVQQEDEVLKNRGLTKWVEKAMNESYPYPGIGNKESFYTFKLSNIEIDGQAGFNTYNKAENVKDGDKLTKKNIFTDYGAR